MEVHCPPVHPSSIPTNVAVTNGVTNLVVMVLLTLPAVMTLVSIPNRPEGLIPRVAVHLPLQKRVTNFNISIAPAKDFKMVVAITLIPLRPCPRKVRKISFVISLITMCGMIVTIGPA